MLMMASGFMSKRFAAMIVACSMLAYASLTFAAAGNSKSKRQAESGPPPITRIEVEPLGYTAPNRFYLVGRFASASLDFIDREHLLFTFRESGLMQRVPEASKDDDDQTICAVVLDIATGKVVQRSKWRMHDRQRYLWAIGRGEFLVRQRNSLYLTDRRLELHPYMQFDTRLQSIAVAPDRQMMILESEKHDASVENDDARQNSQGPLSLKDVKRPSTQILIVHIPDQAPIARSETRHVVDLPLVQNGFLELLEGDHPDKWVVRNRPFSGDGTKVVEVTSACNPEITTLSNTVGLAIGCTGGSSDHMVTAFSLTGTVLWRDRWQPRYIWPTFEFAENGTRFAYGSLELNHSIGSMDPFGEDDVVAQMVGVFDTETGKLEMVKTASPILSAGHNYALSEDGERFAILREGAIEVYDLPPAPAGPVIAKSSPK
jgi:hypothetical protein